MIVAADSILITWALHLLLRHSETNERDSGDEMHRSHKSTELSLILLMPRSITTSVVGHDHLLIWRASLTRTQTNTASSVCAALSHTSTHFPLFFQTHRSCVQIQLSNFYNYRGFIYKMTSVFSVFFVCFITDRSVH